METTILTVGSEKGGVGKTTLALHILWALIAGGKKVLFIDCDPQGNASSALGISAKSTIAASNNSAYLFTSKDCVPLHTDNGVDLIPAHGDLEFVESLPQNKTVNEFKQRVMGFSNYDFIVIDTPPSRGTRLRAGLAAAHSVISPMECATFSLEGLETLLDTIKEVQRDYSPDMKHAAIVANKFRKSLPAHHKVLELMREHTGSVTLEVPLGLYGAIEATTGTGKPVWQGASSGSARTASENMKSVIMSILGRI